jgi:hypothetical protein
VTALGLDVLQVDLGTMTAAAALEEVGAIIAIVNAADAGSFGSGLRNRS